ncbi:Trp biosynthesis-associated membrane protein [Nocardioides sp.]|uniref:Trp biosynthesis-associated membrane protein n=1 Tax=Nocardioides sp. TaxID=35761 RepID=UPI003D0C65CB
MADEVEEAPRKRSTFGPVLLLGLGAGALTALAANRATVGVDSGPASDASVVPIDATLPLTTALSLVVLAAWGVLLVTRGRFRRAMAWLVVITAVGAAVSVVGAFSSAQDTVRRQLENSGITDASVHTTIWFWAAASGAALSVAAGCLAVRLVARWPEMGSRYDAPGAVREVEPESNLDLWKAIEEGRDPTV